MTYVWERAAASVLSGILNDVNTCETWRVMCAGAARDHGPAGVRGGWCALVAEPSGREHVLTGGAAPTTLTEMMLEGALAGVRRCPPGSLVVVRTPIPVLADLIEYPDVPPPSYGDLWRDLHQALSHAVAVQVERGRAARAARLAARAAIGPYGRAPLSPDVLTRRTRLA